MIKRNNYRNVKNSNSSISFMDRLFSVITYLTMGTFGFIWMIVSHIRGTGISYYLRFNILQSIFISISLYLLEIICRFFVAILMFVIKIIAIIPFIGSFLAGLISSIMYFTMNFGIFNYTIPQIIFLVYTFYVVFMSLTGRYPELPYVSNNLIRKNM